MDVVENLVYIILLVVFVMISIFAISYLSSRFIVRGMLDEETYSDLLRVSMYNRLYSCGENVSYLDMNMIGEKYDKCFPSFKQIVAELKNDTVEAREMECSFYTKICDLYGNCNEYGDKGFWIWEKNCSLLYRNLGVSSEGELLIVKMYLCCK